MIYKLLPVLLFIHLAAFVFAGAPLVGARLVGASSAGIPRVGTSPVQVEKHFIKRYGSVTNQQLVIDNQYGNIEVRAWPKKEILIDVTIITSAQTKLAAERLSKQIAILDDRTPGQISYRTVISPLKDSLSKDSSAWEEQLKTVYKVFMPPGQSLRIKNEFGNIELTGCSGHITVDQAFGNFNADYASIDSLNLEQGDIFINSLAHGTITAKGFDLIKIGSITGDVNCDFKLGKTLYIGLPNGGYTFRLVATNISDANLQCASDLSANVTLQTKACNFSNRSNLVLQSDREEILARVQAMPPDTSSSHKNGKFKALNPVFLKAIHYHSVGPPGKATIQIKADFGRMTLK